MLRFLKNILIVSLLAFSINLGASNEIIIWAEDSTSITMDRITVQKIFTRKITRWPSGRNITVYTKPLSSIEHRDFVINVLEISPFFFQRQLEEQTFSGRASSVVEITNDSQMILKIENNPGSIGYINYKVYSGNKEVIIVDLK